MNGFPGELEQLLEKMARGEGGTHGREATRARLEALIASNLTASLGRLGTELIATREQMARSSEAAARHERALVRWTVVLSVATIAYTVITAGLLITAVVALVRGHGGM